jgi:transcriptional regulator with XRE-family HTH domain
VAAAEIKAMRRRLRLTQRQFAGWFGFPAATLRHWERGNRHPTGSALVLLSVIRENPRVVMQAVRKARTFAPGSLPEIEPLASYRAPPGFGERPPPLRKRGPRRKR